MNRLLAAAGLSLLLLMTSLAFAVPSAPQVERAMAQGNWQQADALLMQVLEQHPDNAHAHYLYGQVLAREGRAAEGLARIEQAKALDPQIRFTDPARFVQTEARIRAAANRISGATGTAPSARQTPNPFAQTQAVQAAPSPSHRGTSMAGWIGIAVLIAGMALVLRWTLRRARSSEDTRADDERRNQLKRATELLNTTRSLKLDARLSSAPGHETLTRDIESLESTLRELVEKLSGSKNPVPLYRVEELEQQLASLKARAEGRPDPAPAAAASGSATLPSAGVQPASAYMQEAERFQQQTPQPPQQPTVIVQQGGGLGGGMGGLLTGVLLGEALSHGRESVVQREVIVDDEARRRAGGDDIDVGQGGNDWNDGGGNGGVDYGNDDSGSWNDS